MNNPFGKKLTYNPVPSVIHWEIIGREKSGKSSLVAQLAKPGIVAIIDSDGRFGDVVPQNSTAEFYPISDKKEDMINVDTVVSILALARTQVGNKVSLIVIDTITNILEPIIQRIQGKAKTTVYDYKDKSDAMKELRHALSLWDCETAWLYHIVEYIEKEGYDYVTKEKNFLTDIEYGRLGRAITISLQIVVNGNGKRGVKVLEARRGRSGIVIWDDSDCWQDFREKIIQAVWGGLTVEDQKELETALPETFDSPAAAVRWAWQYSENHNVGFKDTAHVQNSLKKLNESLKEQLAEDYNVNLLWPLWVEKVVGKEVEIKKE